MASSAAKSRPPPPVQPPPPGKQVVAAQFIDQELKRTRTQVRLVDLGTSLMTLAAAVLAYLLLVSLVDHWIFDLGFAGRWVSLVLLAAFVVCFVVVKIAPLLLHQINPLYAARAIEEGTPALKNSLINFLQLRRQRASVHQLVYRVVERQAATGLANVPADVAVDRSRMIRVGYVLSGVLTVAACYKILSPKDPFQSVARVATPWASIARPTRVEILEVQPGDVTVFHGETVNVKAVIRGTADDVQVLFSTSDGQLVDRAAALQQIDASSTYQGMLPPSSSGVEQDMIYRVTAGDAISSDHSIRVSAAPSIRVERVEYNYPAYTRREPKVLTDTGEIEALEGTRVKIHARANQRIRSAYLEMVRGGTGQTESSARDIVRLPLEVEDDQAWRTLVIRFDDDRVKQQFSSYQIRFVTEAGHENREPIRHAIQVLRDLAPEVELLTPTKSRIELPLDGRQEIEVRALDPDFGLRRVTLQAAVGERDLPDRLLLEDQSGWLGQSVVRTPFVPADLDLSVGDRFTYWAVAEDNREDGDGQSDPNRVRTRSYEILVTAPREPRWSGDESPGDGEGSSPDGGDESTGEESSAGAGEGVAAGGASEEEGADDSEQQGGGQSDANASGESEAQPADGTGAGDSGEASSKSEGSGGQQERSSAEGGQPAGDAAAGSESANDGSGEELHDGEVFERALEYLKEQQREGGARAGEENQGEQTGEAGQTGEGATGSARERSAADEGREGSPESGAGDSQTEAGSTSDSASGSPANDSQRASDEAASEGAGGEQGGNEPSAGQRGGETGSAQADKDSASGAMTDADNRDVEKRSGAPQDDVQREEVPSGSSSDPQSDSEGSTGGDMSGGGQEGAGQNANQPGQKSSGGGSAVDEGAGAAEGAGTGETSDAAGAGENSRDPSGHPGSESGDGSRSRADPSGDRSRTDASPESAQGADSRPDSAESSGAGADGGRDSSMGGGQPSETARSEATNDGGEVAPADKANLEYAKNATNLVLEHLEDQQTNPDKALLEKLGWTGDELREFVARWRRLKGAAREDLAEERKLNDTLRGLGIRPPPNRLRTGDSDDERLDGLRESGSVSSPPANFREQFDAFRRSRSRLRDE